MVNKTVNNLHKWKLVLLMPLQIQNSTPVVSGLPCFIKQNKGKKYQVQVYCNGFF